MEYHAQACIYITLVVAAAKTLSCLAKVSHMFQSPDLSAWSAHKVPQGKFLPSNDLNDIARKKYQQLGPHGSNMLKSAMAIYGNNVDQFLC